MFRDVIFIVGKFGKPFFEYLAYENMKNVQTYLPPGELADAGHGEGHGGVEVPARHSARHQHAEQRAQTPAAGDKRQ